MEVLQFHDPAVFAAEVTPFLMRNEAANCFLLGYIPTLTNPTNVTLLLARDAGGVVAVATMTPGRQMAMTEAPSDAVRALVQFLIDHKIDPPGIQGPPREANEFAKAWLQKTGKHGPPKTELGIYQLDKVIQPPPAPGAIYVPQAADVPSVAQWIEEFRTEIGEAKSGETSETLARDRVGKGSIFFWRDGKEFVAMAGFSGSTPHGMRVILVYTPVRFRKRGYASNLVAALSQRLLDSGKQFCFLYTDLASPTSNKIYRDIGYRQVGQSVYIVFDPKPSQ